MKFKPMEMEMSGEYVLALVCRDGCKKIIEHLIDKCGATADCFRDSRIDILGPGHRLISREEGWPCISVIVVEIYTGAKYRTYFFAVLFWCVECGPVPVTVKILIWVNAF